MKKLLLGLTLLSSLSSFAFEKIDADVRITGRYSSFESDHVGKKKLKQLKEIYAKTDLESECKRNYGSASGIKEFKSTIINYKQEMRTDILETIGTNLVELFTYGNSNNMYGDPELISYKLTFEYEGLAICKK